MHRVVQGSTTKMGGGTKYGASQSITSLLDKISVTNPWFNIKQMIVKVEKCKQLAANCK